MIESVVTKRLGALPVAAEFLRQLDVAGIVDALCPPDPRAELTHGQVIEVLVANRLTAPAPLFRVGDWARSWAVEEVFGVEADLLGDDRASGWPPTAASREVDFIAPVPASKISDEFWAGLDLQQAAPVDYTAERDLPPEQRGHYRVLQDIQRIPGPRKRDPVLQVRRILVHSTGNAAGQRQARTKRLAKATAELEKVQRGAGGRYYNTAEKLAARVGAIAKTRRVASCLRTEIGTDEEGRPTLAWHFDEQVLAVQAAADGWYALIASRPIEQATPAQVLLDYKGQGDAERRYGDFKGTLAVTPVFVQHNRRVAALVQVICLALLVFCLIERQVRQALERDGDGTMPGIYPGRRRVRPTGRIILHHLGELQLRIRGATDPPTIILSQVVQVDLLDLLGLDLRRPRWLQT
ncbi:DUF4277 domain-containing protein [Streptomyces pratensis]|uniref:IS1634 family transposase n=1 Tax=Streptomyces pratensis TaxID=1169025 RepID=UPI003793C9F0